MGGGGICGGVKHWLYPIVRSNKSKLIPFTLKTPCVSAALRHAPSHMPLPRSRQRRSLPAWPGALFWVWFNAGAGDANPFCLWLPFAVGCLSLFLEQIKLDGFHNGVGGRTLPAGTTMRKSTTCGTQHATSTSAHLRTLWGVSLPRAVEARRRNSSAAQRWALFTLL